MYELPRNRLRALAGSPFSDGFTAVPVIALVLLLFPGGWVMAGAAVALIVFFA